MRELKNKKIREAIKKRGVYQWEVAAALGISDVTFSKMMARTEMDKETSDRVLKAIDSIA